MDRFEGSTGSNSVLWGGLVNLSTLIGANARLMLNNTYNRTADNDARVERGRFEGRVVYQAELRPGRFALVEEWVPAELLTPTDP